MILTIGDCGTCGTGRYADISITFMFYLGLMAAMILSVVLIWILL